MPKLYRSKGLRRLAACFFVYFALTGVCDRASGFSPSHSKPTLKLARANEWQLSASTAPVDNDAGLSYGERSRPFRRDLFAYDDWVDHRRSDRFGGSLFSVFRSGVFQQLLKEIYLTTGIATFVCLYNALLVTGYDDLVGIHHDPLVQGLYVLAIPGIFFTVTSPALSLLLGTSQQSNENYMLKTFCALTRCNCTQCSVQDEHQLSKVGRGLVESFNWARLDCSLQWTLFRTHVFISLHLPKPDGTKDARTGNSFTIAVEPFFGRDVGGSMRPPFQTLRKSVCCFGWRRRLGAFRVP
jgi:hypothetical protein